MTARNNYSDEVKAAVMAALMEGQSVSTVSKDYKIPVGTIKSWKSRKKVKPSSCQSQFNTGLLIAMGMDSNSLAISELSKKYEIPSGTIRGMFSQAKRFTDEEYHTKFNFRNLPNEPDGSGARFIYLVQEDFYGLVKIGIAKNLSARVASMQADCPQELTLLGYFETKAAQSIEKFLHDKFSHRRYRSEWYNLIESDIELILSEGAKLWQKEELIHRKQKQPSLPLY